MNKIIATSALAAVALSQDAKDANRRNLVNLLDHYNKGHEAVRESSQFAVSRLEGNSDIVSWI